jgi:hypothetical protein
VVFDDGTGPAPTAGNFMAAGGNPAIHLKWNGSTWSGLPGMSGDSLIGIAELAVFDDGSGPALYVGGRFSSIGGVTARNIAKWDGTSWSALGAGLGTTNDIVHALAVFDDGAGPRLYAGGDIGSYGYVARWNGAGWDARSGTNGPVSALHRLRRRDRVSLRRRYVRARRGGSANNIARWRNSAACARGGTNMGVWADRVR